MRIKQRSSTIMRKVFSIFLVSVILLFSSDLSVYSKVFAESTPDSSLIPNNYVPIKPKLNFTSLARSSNSENKVLLIEDTLPWGLNSNQDALTKLGIPFIRVESSQLATVDFEAEHIKVILIASVQQTETYSNLAANKVMLEKFVKNGGTLIVHGADQSSSDYSWQNYSFLPGGVTHQQTYITTGTISDSSHPIMNGIDKNDLTGSYFAHGYFENLTDNTKTIMTGDGEPIYIEYQVGSGEVLATTNTMEFRYHNYNSGVPMLLNELNYAFNQINSPTVKILDLTDSSTVTGTVAIHAQANQANSITVTVTNLVTGETVYQESTSQLDNTFQWDSAFEKNGQYKITVEASTSDGRTAKDERTVTVTNASPQMGSSLNQAMSRVDLTAQQSGSVQYTGDLVFQSNDLDLPNHYLSTSITRSYNSFQKQSSELGIGWSLAIPKLVPNENGDVTYLDSTGKAYKFTKSDGNHFQTSDDTKLYLIKADNGSYELQTPTNNHSWVFDSNGVLQAEKDGNQNEIQ